MNWNRITPSPPPFALLRTPPMSSTLKLIVSFSLITCAIYLYIHMYMYRYMNSICWIQCNVISPETIYTQITRLLILKSHPGSLILLTLSHLCLGILSSLFFSHFLPLLSFSGPVQSTDYVQCATFFSLRWTFQDTLTALPLIFTMKTSSTIKKRKERKQSRWCVLGEMERWKQILVYLWTVSLTYLRLSEPVSSCLKKSSLACSNEGGWEGTGGEKENVGVEI